ncbi:uncharacterized protein BYT42DRAFT_575596 [Radiomyces spectabilis]|uniref:uncharacterized protein n=1 Tax=Radiomyces spectabilis TaxID=64574 RepID=UPI002220F471|nr:uncharacterized protein BYT42DRAFT_575596 [Radiomyces spectabilis]KAI8374237.1 hypothetical protein BYT42DRAFT_575596 [Radiomyces spectabilis]
MSKRFQNLNKYRNVTGNVAKKEHWYCELPISTSPSSDNANLVQASRQWIAVQWGANGGSMGLLPHCSAGKNAASEANIFHAHSAAVSDWHFSEFDDNLLATAGEDKLIKLWKIPEEKTSPTCLTTLTASSRRVDLLRFHPTAAQIITSLGNDGKKVTIWDIEKENARLELASEKEAIHSFSWKSDGSVLATSAKSLVQVWDPRAETQVLRSGSGHEGIKGSRVVWLGDSNYVFSVGVNKLRNRQYALWDSRDLSKPLTMKPFTASTGVLTPLYDEDTGTMYMISRGDSTIRSMQISDLQTTPSLSDNMVCMTGTSLYGACLVPKLSLDVMQAEIARVLAVTQNAVATVSMQIPRRQYLDFHAELFPDTKGQVPALSGEEWFDGKTAEVAKVSLDPSKRKSSEHTALAKANGIVKNDESTKPVAATSPVKEDVSNEKAPSTATITQPAKEPINEENAPSAAATAVTSQVSNGAKQTPAKPTESSEAKTAAAEQGDNDQSKPAKPPAKKTPRYGAANVSPYKYLVGKFYHPSTYYDDLRGLSINKSGTFDLIQANTSFIAVPITGPGGRVGIISVDKPGRLPVHIPSLLCGSEVTNFQFDPFNNQVIATASEDNKIRVWSIPEGGLEEDIGEPEFVLSAPNMDKIGLLQFHPIAENVLMSASTDMGHPTIRLWDLKEKKDKCTLSDVCGDMIFSCAWSPCGTKIAVASREKKLRIIDARSGKVLADGASHSGVRPSKLLWLGDTECIASVGFGPGSMREIIVYKVDDLSKLSTKTIDMSPSVMSAFYDADCRILYVAGRGDRNIHTYELENDCKLTALAKIEAGTLQQGFAFLPKRVCNVKEIEIDKFYRLTPTLIETVGVRVPRARPEYFQDEIFVDTPDVEHPAQDSASWFEGNDKHLNCISLKPEDMTPLSEAPPPPQQATSKAKFEMGKKIVSEDQRRQELMDRMFSTAKEVDDEDEEARKKAQNPEDQEVADDEWDD